VTIQPKFFYLAKDTHRYLSKKTDMLHIIHEQFGTVGSILVALLAFTFIILWIAAISGIHEYPYSDKRKLLITALFILIPPYALIWLGKDMYRQYKILKLDKD
jgi:cell division protein FtsW (lipid II flippase)